MITQAWTVGFQVVNFLVLLFLLHRYLWKPVRAAIERRKKEIDDADAGVKARAKAADERRAAYEAKAEAADGERARLLVATAAALAADREKVLAEARAATAAERRTVRASLDEERSKAVGELTDATLDVGLTLAKKLLDEVQSAAIAGAFLDRICEHLEGLPVAELASLRVEAEKNPAIQIATAPALDDAAQARLRARLVPFFGPAAKLDFVVDDALIAGAELRLPHHRIGHSFRHGLAAARRALSARRTDGAERANLTSHEEIVDR